MAAEIKEYHAEAIGLRTAYQQKQPTLGIEPFYQKYTSALDTWGKQKKRLPYKTYIFFFKSFVIKTCIFSSWNKVLLVPLYDINNMLCVTSEIPIALNAGSKCGQIKKVFAVIWEKVTEVMNQDYAAAAQDPNGVVDRALELDVDE